VRRRFGLGTRLHFVAHYDNLAPDETTRREDPGV
jgi:hypothetical protein